MGHTIQRKLPVYHHGEEAYLTQVEPSPLLCVIALSHHPDIRKPPARLRVNQGKVPVGLLCLGLFRETIEEPLPSLVKPFRNLLRNLRMQRVELRVPLPEV